MPIKIDKEIDGETESTGNTEEECFIAPDGRHSLDVKPYSLANHSCLLAHPGCKIDLSNCQTFNAANGILVVLDGARIFKRIGRLVEKGTLDVSRLPLMVGINASDDLGDYTPWWHPAFKEEAPDFGGNAEEFRQLVLQVTAEIQAVCVQSSAEVPLGLMGYSLAGLFCLDCLMYPVPFSTLLVASPSTWYAGFVNRLARTDFKCSPSVVIACGQNEGKGHPEPIAGIMQDTTRATEVLKSKLSKPVELIIDDKGHHDGLTLRLKKLLLLWSEI